MEFYGAPGQRVRDGHLPERLAERAAKRYDQHRTQRLYHFIIVNPDHYQRAAALTRRFILAVKAPDALHLAVVQREGLELITSDGGMASVARSLSLAVTLVGS